MNLSKVLRISKKRLHRFLQVFKHPFACLTHLNLGNSRLFLVDGEAKPKDNTNLSERSWRGSGPLIVSGGFPRAGAVMVRSIQIAV